MKFQLCLFLYLFYFSLNPPPVIDSDVFAIYIISQFDKKCYIESMQLKYEKCRNNHYFPAHWPFSSENHSFCCCCCCCW